MTVRPAERSDVPRILDLWEALMANGQQRDDRWVPSEGARHVMEDWGPDLWLPKEPFPHAWVAEADRPEGARVVAWLDGHPSFSSPVLAGPRMATIGNLWVEPAWRRRGFGRALVEAFVDAATRGGCHAIEVGTLTHDARAVGFWHAMGFGDWRVTLRRDAAD